MRIGETQSKQMVIMDFTGGRPFIERMILYGWI